MAKSKLPPSAERRSKAVSKVDALMAEIAALSDDEREQLLDRIEFEYPGFDPTDIPEWHKEILKQRLAEAKKNPGAGRPWREVLDELRNKL